VLAAALVVGALPTVTVAGADATRQETPTADIALEVDGDTIPLRVVVRELEDLARNDALAVVRERTGDASPTPEVVATWITSLVNDRVVAHELEGRGIEVTDRQLRSARRQARNAYGRRAWDQFPGRFRERTVARTARAAALAQDEGLDITDAGDARRLAELVQTLARAAVVTVAPRFGSWDPTAGAVAPPREGGPAS
jgi:hypothetical protein